MKKFFLILLMINLYSCNFKPINKTYTTELELNKIAIETDSDKMSHNLYLTLSDLFNPNSVDIKPEYKLIIKLKKYTEAVAIQTDSSATRYNVVIEANYSLTNLLTGKFINKDYNLSIIGSYDVVASEYATYVAEENTTENIIKELAQEIKIHVIRSLYLPDKI